MPLLDSPRSCCTVGAAIDTIVWSMNVIATAKIIAVRTRLLDWPRPLAASAMTFPLRSVPAYPRRLAVKSCQTTPRYGSAAARDVLIIFGAAGLASDRCGGSGVPFVRCQLDELVRSQRAELDRAGLGDHHGGDPLIGIDH